MNIPQKIDEILLARQEQAKKVERAKSSLEEVRQTMLAFQSLRGALAQGGNEELAGKLNAIVVDRFISDCDSTLEELDRLYKRFSRDHVHMSFVGKARQGKSLVMQKISGLDGSVIPSADGEHCTGAKSIITNTDEPETVGEITFYRADEIVQIVNDYLQEIFGKDEPKIRLLSDIPALAKRRLEERLDPHNTSANSRWKHLWKYIEHTADFQVELGGDTERVITVSGDQIESYVAQYKSTDPDTRYYKYLGVKEANIRCRFPAYETCGKVVLVDTIGLGDTSIGVEEEMIRAIREDSDAIVYMFRPDIKGPIVDAQHYQIIQDIAEKVSVEYAEEMLFWVFNRDMSGGESKARLISRLARDMEEERKGNRVAICRALDVNCMDAEEVESRLLAPVLRQMSERLEVIDSLLVKQVQTRLDQIFDAYQILSAQIQSAYSRTVSQDVRRQFEDNIDQTFNVWTNNLRQLCLARKKQRDLENERFSSEFQRKLKQILTRLPSQTEIENYLASRLGSMTQHDLYIRVTQYIRVRVIDDFLTLDNTLDELVRDLKWEIVHILADPDKGKLGFVIPISESDDPDEWLDSAVQAAESGGYDSIDQALRSLRDFSMSVKGFFIFAVRNGLDPIDAALQESLPRIEGSEVAEMASSIHSYLKRCIIDVQKQVREGCRNYLSFPNSALYAAVRDFWDRSAFSVPSLERQSTEIRRKWQHFYEDHIPEIWSEECASYTAASRMNEDFSRLVRDLKASCRKSNFQI